MASKGHSIANAPGFFLKGEVKKETKEEIEAYVNAKMEIVDDFCIGKNKLKAKERKELRQAMLKIKTLWGIDRYFQEFVYSKM